MTPETPARPFILIAEDDKALSAVHKVVFSDAGFDVAIVENGDEAVKAIDACQPRLLLLDILMPKSDGFAVLRYIREKQYTFPVIVLTNLSSEHDIREVRELGAKACYVKSDTDIDQLMTIIKQELAAA